MLSFNTFASACETPESVPRVPSVAEESNEVTPRAMMCNICYNGRTITSFTYYNYRFLSESFCSHYLYGTDVTDTRTVIYENICESCHQGSQFVYDEERIVCKGFNSYSLDLFSVFDADSEHEYEPAEISCEHHVYGVDIDGKCFGFTNYRLDLSK